MRRNEEAKQRHSETKRSSEGATKRTSGEALTRRREAAEKMALRRDGSKTSKKTRELCAWFVRRGTSVVCGTIQLLSSRVNSIQNLMAYSITRHKRLQNKPPRRTQRKWRTQLLWPLKSTKDAPTCRASPIMIPLCMIPLLNARLMVSMAATMCPTHLGIIRLIREIDQTHGACGLIKRLAWCGWLWRHCRRALPAQRDLDGRDRGFACTLAQTRRAGHACVAPRAYLQ